MAKALGGSVNSGSGNGWVRKGDVRAPEELWECKITDAKSYSLKDADLQKAYNYGLMDGLISIFMVEFKSSGNSWVILSKDDYMSLRERASVGNETP